MKLKKINAWYFGCVLALAMVLFSLVQMAVSFILGKFPAFLAYLQTISAVWVVRIIGLIITLILGLVTGLVFAVAYNLMAKWKALDIEFEARKK